MVRKRFSLSRDQDQLLKRLVRQRGVSEAAVIRQALEREGGMPDLVQRDSTRTLQAMIQFARSLRERPELMQGEAYQFRRGEIYAEREGRRDSPVDGRRAAPK